MPRAGKILKSFTLQTKFHNTVLGEGLDKNGKDYVFTLIGPNLAWAKSAFLESINASHFIITPDGMYWPMLYTRVVISGGTEAPVAKQKNVPAINNGIINSIPQVPVYVPNTGKIAESVELTGPDPTQNTITKKPRKPRSPNKTKPVTKSIRASQKRGR